MHLKRYWQKIQAQKQGLLSGDSYAEEWNIDQVLLSALNLGLEQTLVYINNSATDFEELEHWIIEVNGGSLPYDKIELFNKALTYKPETGDTIEQVLTDEELAFWDENGYLIIPGVISKNDCEDAVQAICNYIDVDLANPATWYHSHPAKQGVMVQLFQHDALDNNRKSEKIRKVYEQLWNRKDLWLNTDRAGFNPPITDSHPYRGFPLHWDVSLELPIPYGLQGILYLTDTAANQGAFTLVPGFHKKIDAWLTSLPEEVNPRDTDIHTLGTKPIAANAGDFIVWHHALPHGSSPNTAHSPRIVQYINYRPINMEIKKKWV